MPALIASPAGISTLHVLKAHADQLQVLAMPLICNMLSAQINCCS